MQSLAVGNSEVEGQSRIIMVIPGSAEGTSKIIKQLNKLVHVQQVLARNLPGTLDEQSCNLAPSHSFETRGFIGHPSDGWSARQL